MSKFLDAITKVTNIVCHDNCADGTASAILLHDVLPNAEIAFCQYGYGQDKLEPKPNMLICDFSPLEARAQEFVDAGTLILDHHKSARATVAAFGEFGVFGDEATEPAVSGAILAYRHAWLPLKQRTLEGDVSKSMSPWSSELNDIRRSLCGAEIARAENFARLIGIRDTWQKHEPDWRRACVLAEAIRFFSQESWLIRDPFAHDRRDWWKSRVSVGERLMEKHQTIIRKALEGAHRFTTDRGTRVVMFSGVRLTSDACEEAGDTTDLVVGFDYFAIEDGQAPLVFSTRAFASSPFNCAEFCKTFGGGGHTKAAGFSIRINPMAGSQDPFSLFKARLREYETAAGIQ